MSASHHTEPRRLRHRLVRLLAVLTILTILLAACSTGGDEDDTASDSGGFDTSDGGDDFEPASDDSADVDDAGGERQSAEPPPAEEAEADDEALAQPTALTPADLGRDIIFRAEIGVEVADVAAAAQEATQRIEALGGIVFGQTTVVEPSPRTVLTFKVAPEDFDTALEQLGGVGELVDQTITADDVTARVVDLESRILTAETSVARLREFLAGATTVQDVAALERELVSRETDLESLRGQLRTLRDQVALATITLTITEAGTERLDAEFDVITGLGETDADACPGSIELETDRDDEAVWCVEIENVGEATLTEIELVSNTLGLRTRDFSVRDGSLEQLEPGQIVRAVIELDIDDGRVRRRSALGGLRLDVTVTATPTDDLERTLARERVVLLVADDEEPLPGFADSFGRGVDVLALIGSVVLVAVGGLLPFVPIVVIGILAVRFVRRRRPTAPTIEE